MSSTTVNLSGSRSRTSTPTRAIHSTLAARAAPTIPPATQTYEPLVKAVLRHRLAFNIFINSAALSWASTFLWTLWDQGGFSNIGLGGFLYNLLSPSIWVLSAINWVVGVLPVIVLRKTYLTAKPSTTPSPSKTFQSALSKPSTLRALFTYVTSATLVTFLHILVAYADTSLSGDPRLTVFVRSRKHPYYLNGRFVFLLSSQIALAFTFLLRSVMLDRFAFRSTSPFTPASNNHPFATANGIKTAITMILFTTLSYTLSTLFFGFFRSLLLPILFRLPLIHYFLRPFSAHFLRGPWTLWLPVRHLSLVSRTFVLGFNMVSNWELADGLFDVFVPQPILVSQNTVDPALTLISGVTSSSNDCYRYFAYGELKLFATDSSPAATAKRTALFGDQKYNPGLWSTLARESLLLLGTDYQLFLRRGQPAPIVPAVPPVAAPKGPQTPQTPLLQKAIFKSTHQSPISSVLDSFASDSKLLKAVEATAEAGATHIPEIFRSVEHYVRAPPNTPVSTPAKPIAIESGVAGGSLVQSTKAEVNGMLGRVKGKAVDFVNLYSPVWVGEAVVWGTEWWRAERVSKVVEGCLPRRELDIVAIEVLSHLTCASLSEDRYGTVQRDIPRIIEAFLSFLSAIEEYQVEINTIHIPLSSEELSKLSPPELEAKERIRIDAAKAGEVLGGVSGALKDGVARIARTFGDKLLAFKFPPRTARKLQGFIDYN